MLPTLEPRGGLVWISRTHRRGRGLRVGDVVSFRSPKDPREDAIKRVLGMPGDFVMRRPPATATGGGVVGGAGGLRRVTEDGKVEPVKGENGYARQREAPEDMLQVPQGHMWVEGDNAPWSRDSREYGPVPLGLVRGKVVARIWPLHGIKRITNTMQELHEG